MESASFSRSPRRSLNSPSSVAPHLRVGVGAQVALAVDQHGRRALQQQLLDDAQRQRRLAGARAAEHGGVALQHVLVERDALAGAQARAPPGCCRRRRRPRRAGRRAAAPSPRAPARECRCRARRGRGLGCHRIAAEQIEPQHLHQRRDLRQQLGVLEPVGEARVLPMLGVELAHHHHALPVGDGHQDRAAAALAELAEGLRRLVLLVGREIARPQHEAVLAHHGRQQPGRAGA
mgnify:CR=1 FL=1